MRAPSNLGQHRSPKWDKDNFVVADGKRERERAAHCVKWKIYKTNTCNPITKCRRGKRGRLREEAPICRKEMEGNIGPFYPKEGRKADGKNKHGVKTNFECLSKVSRRDNGVAHPALSLQLSGRASNVHLSRGKSSTDKQRT